MDLMLLNSGPAGQQPNATQSIWPMLIMIVVTIALMYFVLIRPQKKILSDWKPEATAIK